MSHDPELVAETGAWFTKAGQDLRVAVLAADAKPPLYAQTVYHAQQTAEKSMKGFLTWHLRTFGKTHNLAELGRACAAIDPTMEPLMRRAGGLTDYVWRYRYPGDPDEPSEQESREAVALAEQVIQTLLSRMPGEVRP
jgi:HEPN domain-containing protein